MSYSVKGKLKRFGNVETVGANGFTKRTFVIETGEQYPQTLEFQLTKDRVDIIEVYKVGEEIEVHFNLRGREWTNNSGDIKVFNTLECWKLVRIGEVAGVNSQSPMNMSNDFDSSEPKTEGKDDLPF